MKPPATSTVRRLTSHQRVRYLIVGAWNTLFGYLVFAALVILAGARMHYLFLLVVAHVISVLNAFVGYRLIVFKARGPWLGSLLRFWSVYAVALSLNAMLLPVLVELLHVPVLAAQAVIVALTVVGTYLAHKHFSFRLPASLPDAIAAGTDEWGCE